MKTMIAFVLTLMFSVGSQAEQTDLSQLMENEVNYCKGTIDLKLFFEVAADVRVLLVDPDTLNTESKELLNKILPFVEEYAKSGEVIDLTNSTDLKAHKCSGVAKGILLGAATQEIADYLRKLKDRLEN